MGAWNESINGNDTAEDLKQEYKAAFFYNDVETALQKIDAYVRQNFDESDEEEWGAYIYSLADFMWKHGILTDQIRDQAIHMIDMEFGLDIWAAEGKATLNKRKKVLAAFRAKLLSPQPEKKKIRFKLYKAPIFEIGDLVALQLKTLDKPYRPYLKIGEEQFRSYDGKYIVIRKVGDEVNEYSSIEPQLISYWAKFQLYDGIFEECPTPEQLKAVPFVPTRDGSTFTSESTLFHLKKRNYRVIGNSMEDLPNLSRLHGLSFVFWGIEPETDVLRALVNNTLI